jgi:hypothetical protein
MEDDGEGSDFDFDDANAAEGLGVGGSSSGEVGVAECAAGWATRQGILLLV